MTLEVMPDVLPRIAANRRDLADTRDHEQALLEARAELLTEAINAGVSQRAVAEAAGIGQSRVIQIVADHDGASG